MSEQFGWSEWIEFKAGVPCPIAWAQADQYEVKWDAEDESLSALPTSWNAVRFWRSVVDPFHYRYSLSAAPAGFVPPGAEKPWVPEQDAADWAADSDLQNRPMFDADDVGVSAGKWDRFNARLAAPTAAPGFMVRAVRSSDGLLTVREADHLLGLWS